MQISWEKAAEEGGHFGMPSVSLGPTPRSKPSPLNTFYEVVRRVCHIRGDHPVASVIDLNLL